MELEKIKRASNSFEKDVAFMKWRWLGNVVLMLALIIALVIVSNRTNYLAVDKQGNVFSLHKVERTDKEIVLIEADAHIRNFYSTMWTFDHNNIDEQQKKAAYLGGNVISKLYTSLQQKGFYNEVRSNGYYVKSDVVTSDLKSFSFDGTRIFLRVFGTMKLSNNDFYETRKLDMEVEMFLVDRILTRNPNGLSIEAINILSNETTSKGENQ